MTVYTIGYEGLDIQSFLSLLCEYDIETIVDVRELPLSRKSGFSKRALHNHLELSGREYVHMPSLGCPRQIRNDFREDGNLKRYIDRFSKYLRTKKDAVEDLSNLVEISNCALLCFEADFKQCHRTLVANAVKKLCNADIVHISKTKVKTTCLVSVSRQASVSEDKVRL